jgi:hypothetical protein
MISPGLYHGKIPLEYAFKRRLTLKSPPNAKSPSSRAYSGGGKSRALADNKKTGNQTTLTVKSRAPKHRRTVKITH